MEVNKDEAYRCLDRAQYYLNEGDVEKAEKFITKSKKLFPTAEADGDYLLIVVWTFQCVVLTVCFFVQSCLRN